MTNPWLLFFILFLTFTVFPSVVSFLIGRWGLPKLVWSRRDTKPTNFDDEDL